MNAVTTAPTAAGQPASPAPPRARVNRTRPALIALAAAAALGWGGHFALRAYRFEETDNAYVVGHLHQVSPQVSAQVKEVLVRDNQTVKAGDVLVRLDPSEFEISAEKARATLAQARAQAAQTTAAAAQAEAQVSEADARVKQSAAQVIQARAQLDLAQLTLNRNEQLLRNGGAVTQAEVDTARSGWQAAKATLEAAEANQAAAQAAIASARAAREAVTAQAAAQEAAVAVATAELHDAERELAYTTITAPTNGRVGNRSVEAGNRVTTGQNLLALAEPSPWIVANFKETQLAHLQPGQEVEITVDAIPGETLRGRVDSVSPASGAQFALLPPDNATGNFNKVVQRVPVKIVPDPESAAKLGDRLRLGYSVIVAVRVR